MKVKVYLPEDVPDGFKYGVITNDYVELFNKSSFQGETATYYRIYYNYNGGVVQTGTRSFLVIHQLIMASFQSHVIF